MTSKREVPISGDSLGWVHNEITELKRRLTLIKEVAEQSRILATGAAESSQQLWEQLAVLETQDTNIQQTRDAVGTLHLQLTRAQDDIQSLRQSRDDGERRAVAESEKAHLDKNELLRGQGELERQIGNLTERLNSAEELSQRHRNTAAHFAQRLEESGAEQAESESWRGRTQGTLNHMDQEIQRLAAAVSELAHENEAQKERTGSAVENLRRLESETEAAHATVSRMSQLDDRLELVQAERTRHNERINELTLAMEAAGDRMGEQNERASLLDARMAGYQNELDGLREKTRLDLETLTAYLSGLADINSDLRKRQIAALEKEIRDIKGHGLDFVEE